MRALGHQSGIEPQMAFAVSHDFPVHRGAGRALERRARNLDKAEAVLIDAEGVVPQRGNLDRWRAAGTR